MADCVICPAVCDNIALPLELAHVPQQKLAMDSAVLLLDPFQNFVFNNWV